MATVIHINAKTLEKYNVLLKFLNKILANIDRPPITDALDFKDIPRTDLLTPQNENIMKDMENEIYEKFSKHNLKCSQKENVKFYMLSLLRSMCHELYLVFRSKSIRTRVDRKFVSEAQYDIIIP